MSFLIVNNITRVENGVTLLQETSFNQLAMEKIAIAGETGSGKTSLLKIIAGLLQPAGGQVFFNDEKVKGPNEKLLPGHPQIAYLSQYFELRNNYRVEEELDCKNLLSEEEANNIYEVCEITHLLKRKTDQLSGGERQRIVLARLLTTSPRLLLLDEPFSNLDMPHKNSIRRVIENIGEKLNITCMLVSHEPADTLSWADKIMVMKQGAIVQQGTPQEIYRHPDSEYSAGLFGHYTILSPLLAAYFQSTFNLDIKKGKILFRPGQFTIAAPDEYPVQGVIRKIIYLGSSCLLSVQLLDQEILVQTLNCSYSINDKICVVPDITSACYINND
jgi:ABC-type sugar transport system ATPase subunit